LDATEDGGEGDHRVKRAALRRPTAWLLVAALAAATVLATSAVSLGATKTISGSGTEWVPPKRKIRVGSRIRWVATNRPHTVTSYRKRSGRRGRRWSKHTYIAQGQSTKKRFRRPGIYRFKCKLHRGMTGRVRVIR
jgi:plastocyanin